MEMKQLKNFEVLNLINGGVAHCTALTLEPAHAYKVGKFRREATKAFGALVEAQKDIFKGYGIEDPDTLNKELAELAKVGNPTDEQKARLEELTKTVKGINEQLSELYNEEAKLEGIKAIPFEEWLALRKENNGKSVSGKTFDIFNNYTEDLLMGILWEEPTE